MRTNATKRDPHSRQSRAQGASTTCVLLTRTWRITQNDTHITAEVSRDFWRLSSPHTHLHTLLKAGSTTAGCRAPYPVRFGIPPRIGTLHSLWANSSGVWRPSKFLMLKWNFPFLVCVHCLLSRPWAPERGLTPSSLLPYIRYLYTLIKSLPEPSFLQTEQSQFSHRLLTWKMLQSLSHLSALHWTRFNKLMSVL